MAIQSAAILLIGYRRPDLTERVLNRLAEVSPQRLYVALDGPASPDVAIECNAVREMVEAVDWPDCAVHINISEQNLGCAERVRTALDWVFDCEEQALVIEDDTLPGAGWFFWAERMLNRYKDDASVGMVCARNPLVRWPDSGEGHLMSRVSMIWGWGTWSDRWRAHRASPQADPECVKRRWPEMPEVGNFRAFLAATDAGQQLDTWDMAWAVWMEASQLSNIVPASNWVENIGFDPRGAHLTTKDDFRGMLPCLTPNHPDESIFALGDFDLLCVFNEILCNGALHNPRKWAMLARNASRVKRPGADVVWAMMLLPFEQPEWTCRLIQHLLDQWTGFPPSQLVELKQILKPS